MARDFWLKTLTGCWNSADSAAWTFARVSFTLPESVLALAICGAWPRPHTAHLRSLQLSLRCVQNLPPCGLADSFYQSVVLVTRFTRSVTTVCVWGGPHHGGVTMWSMHPTYERSIWLHDFIQLHNAKRNSCFAHGQFTPRGAVPPD